MGDKEPVEVVARSGDRVLGELGTRDATLGIFTMADRMLWSMTDRPAAGERAEAVTYIRCANGG